MKEILFIRQNIEKWKELEPVVDRADKEDPERLADAYMEITTDLAFARSHYPTSRITIYLNNLASALHNTLYKNKREDRARLLDFWRTELPMTFYASRRELLYALLIFLVSTLIGAFSTAQDADFPRLILGDDYVDMTIRNIKAGTPTAVYDDGYSWMMFFRIVTNNLFVAFDIFVVGLFTGVATAFHLFRNGIMLGAFQAFFFRYHVGWESALAIWMHGTLEILSIIIAGAAGFALGNGWLFPGTYPRGYAFRQGARRGLKIIIGVAPFFIVAGFIESFLTRLTWLPDALRATFILVCLAFMIVYVVFYPRYLWRKAQTDPVIH